MAIFNDLPDSFKREPPSEVQINPYLGNVKIEPKEEIKTDFNAKQIPFIKENK